MKKFLLLISAIMSFLLHSSGQDVHFPPAVISTGGSSFSNGNATVSRWRIGQIHVITLPSEENIQKKALPAFPILPIDSLSDWTVTLFPNPVQTRLMLRFIGAASGLFAIEIFDVNGRKMIHEKVGIHFPGQVSELDLSDLTPAIYLLKIIPFGEGMQKQFKITKQ